MSIGRGYAGLRTFSGILGTQCIEKKTFSKCFNNLCVINESMKMEMFQLSRKTNMEVNLKVDLTLLADNILNITVSNGGTWQKRGPYITLWYQHYN